MSQVNLHPSTGFTSATNGPTVNLSPMVQGDRIGVFTSGTFGGATVTIQVSADGGTTWVPTSTTFTAAGYAVVEAIATAIRAVVSGGSGQNIQVIGRGLNTGMTVTNS